jgi:hypothetical protein
MCGLTEQLKEKLLFVMKSVREKGKVDLASNKQVFSQLSFHTCCTQDFLCGKKYQI